MDRDPTGIDRRRCLSRMVDKLCAALPALNQKGDKALLVEVITARKAIAALSDELQQAWDINDVAIAHTATLEAQIDRQETTLATAKHKLRQANRQLQQAKGGLRHAHDALAEARTAAQHAKHQATEALAGKAAAEEQFVKLITKHYLRPRTRILRRVVTRQPPSANVWRTMTNCTVLTPLSGFDTASTAA